MTDTIGRRSILAGAGWLAALGLAAGPARATTAGTIRLRLLETSDLHTFDEDYDYFRDKPDETVGLTKVATLIHAARAETKNSLLFDNGDIIQGNPLADYMAAPGHFPKGATHPTIRAMNTLHYDAATVGNHEFNYGLPFLEAALAGARFPFVCANIERADGAPFLPPSLVLERRFVAEDGTPHTLRIGVIGFVTPQIVDWDKAHLAGKITTTDIVEAAQRYVPGLRAKSDLVIALSHSGISTAERTGGEENASFYLASVPGIDVIFTGHSHRVFPGPTYAGHDGVDAVHGTLAGVPAVMPGFWGSHLGVIDLTLARENNRWTVADFIATARPIYRRDGHTVISLAANDAQIDAAVAPEHAKTLAWIRQPIGRLQTPLNSYNALTGDDASLALVNTAQIWYAAPLLAGTDAAKLPLLSAAAPFKEGFQGPDDYVDLRAGTIAIKDVADLYMYANTVTAVRVNGGQLKAWLERSAEIFNTIDPTATDPQPLINPHVPAYSFDVISGITYRIDITKPKQNRIVDLAFHGQPIAATQNFVVVTNNYRTDSGEIVPSDDPQAVVLRAPDQTRDVIVRYVLAHPDIAVTAPHIWSFAPIGKPVTVTFRSAPAAAATLAASGAKQAGTDQDGFGLYTLTLS